MPNKTFMPYGSNIEFDKLVDGTFEDKIKAVRKHHGLNKLINDSNSYVRAEIAKQGYFLDTLVNDEAEDVRIAVAGQGYGLDKLNNDSNYLVKTFVNKWLFNNNYLFFGDKKPIDAWVEDYPDMCALESNVIPFQLRLLKEYIQNYELEGNVINDIESLYDFSQRIFSEHGAEIEFNEGLPIEVCVADEINEPLENWRISNFLDLQHINFDANNKIEDFCCERFDLYEVSPDKYLDHIQGDANMKINDDIKKGFSQAFCDYLKDTMQYIEKDLSGDIFYADWERLVSNSKDVLYIDEHFIHQDFIVDNLEKFLSDYDKKELINIKNWNFYDPDKNEECCDFIHSFIYNNEKLHNIFTYSSLSEQIYQNKQDLLKEGKKSKEQIKNSIQPNKSTTKSTPIKDVR